MLVSCVRAGVYGGHGLVAAPAALSYAAPAVSYAAPAVSYAAPAHYAAPAQYAAPLLHAAPVVKAAPAVDYFVSIHTVEIKYYSIIILLITFQNVFGRKTFHLFLQISYLVLFC